MGDAASSRHKGSALTQTSFDCLLAALDANRERAGEQYELVRRKLVKFFEWHASPTPEDEADETIGRVARRIEDGETIENLAAYFYGVARHVLLEACRERRRDAVAAREAATEAWQEDPAEIDARLRCLDQCLEPLPATTREMLMSYYQGEKAGRIRQRHQLAESEGIPMNALRIRVHRLRAKLEECVTQCVSQSVA